MIQSHLNSFVATIWQLGSSSWAPVNARDPVTVRPAVSATRDHLVDALLSSTSLLSNIIAELGDEFGNLRKRGVVLSTRLRAASRCLGTDTPAISSTEAQALASDLLQEIERIATWPAQRRETIRSPEDILRTLDNATSGSQNDIKASAKNYMAEAESFLVDIAVQLCNDLIEKLSPGSPDDEIQVREDELLPQATEELLDAIWTHSVCRPHHAMVQSTDNRARHHPTVLFLGQPRQTRDVATQFDILTSCHSLHYWQEIGLAISPDGHGRAAARKPKKRVAFKDTAPPLATDRLRSMRPEAIPNFCSLLGRKNSARVYLELGGFSLFEDEIVQRLHHDATPGGGIPLSRVLQEYHLSIPERIVLCHTIARSFWQFYDTKMMLAKWTSQNIWFMPSSGDPKSPSLPCRAYISFPFERAEYELEEYSTAGLIHRCPRIFALAVLLLEISLARPIETCRLQWDAEDFVGRTNVDHKRAMTQLQELRADSWTNYTGKHIYNFAIRECVVGTSFLPGGGSGSPQLAERRRIFYEKVVAPLQMVAGSYGREGMVEIKKKIIDLNTTNNSPRLFLQPTGTISASPDELIISKFPSFHTDRIANPEDWLEDLKTIGSYVHSIKTKSFPNAGVRPIRVAILDSGCNLDAPYFRDERESQRAGRIIEWKDFVDGSITKTDSFGHGTLMASLVIETSIVAELCLARVAENTEQLDGSEGRISDAIRWAGVHCEADIISMSFDVDDGEGSIKDAIRFVQNERNGRVIFFASAGNLGPHQDVAFPACHKDVIAIRATNYMGVVASSNPSTDPSAAVSLATFGDNIPLRLQESNPEVCKPGSSVATAVAAGIAATMLSYASMLPHIHPGHAKEDDLTRLRTVEGIEALFRLKLSQNMGNRINFVNPVRFFMENETNLLRLYAILDCLRKVR